MALHVLEYIRYITRIILLVDFKMLPKHVAIHADLLRSLARSKPNVLKKQLPSLDASVIRALKNISKNYIKGRVSLKPGQKAELRKHKRFIKELSLAKTSLKRGRKILSTGGFLAALIKPIASLLGSLLFK